MHRSVKRLLVVLVSVLTLGTAVAFADPGTIGGGGLHPLPTPHVTPSTAGL